MLSESTPEKSENGKWFLNIQKMLDAVRSEYQLALHDQGIDHSSNITRIDTIVEKIRDTMAADRKDIDKLLNEPPECPDACHTRIGDLGDSVNRRFDALGKTVDERFAGIATNLSWRNWLLGTAIAVALITNVLNVIDPRLLAGIQRLFGVHP